MSESRTEPPFGTVIVGAGPLSIEDVVAIAASRAKVELSRDHAYRERLESGVLALSRILSRGERIYGVTTGFGDACDADVGPELRAELAKNLVRYHQAGAGPAFNRVATRAIVAARLASLSRGYSGVRALVLDGLAALLNADVCPFIPEAGSVGASGDLTPLAYVAAVLSGEGSVLGEQGRRPAHEALIEAGLDAIVLLPKEALALMNGTSAMTGLAVLGFERSTRLARLAAALTALAVEALRGEPAHFDDRIFQLKPHPGQRAFARWIREDMGESPGPRAPDGKLQDRYSVRCAPHVAGVLVDVLPMARAFLETELDSVNDNPIVLPETGEVLRSGNFYGGHVCQAADTLKTCVANVADLLDRQLALLVDPRTSNGLPRDLVLVTGPSRLAHHGFKAMQITASALTAEALKLTMPASVFSRSTESHNQDKVSLGTIAARDLLRVLELTETVAAIHLLALCQALDCRGGPRGPRARAVHAAVRARVPKNDADRPMDVDIEAALELHRSSLLPIPHPSPAQSPPGA